MAPAGTPLVDVSIGQDFRDLAAFLPPQLQAPLGRISCTSLIQNELTLEFLLISSNDSRFQRSHRPYSRPISA
jgi:hypothetical protein